MEAESFEQKDKKESPVRKEKYMLYKGEGEFKNKWFANLLNKDTQPDHSYPKTVRSNNDTTELGPFNSYEEAEKAAESVVEQVGQN